MRKLSGFARPSKVNEEAFNRAVKEVAAAAHVLLDSLVTKSEPKERVYTYVAEQAAPATHSTTPRCTG